MVVILEKVKKGGVIHPFHKGGENMKTKIVVALLILAGLGAGLVWWKQGGKAPTLPSKQIVDTTSEDITVIRSFMSDPNLELVYKGTDLPQPYFMVGKVSQLEKGGGIKIEKVSGWERLVNVYEQKGLINGTCSVYEYHTDPRSHKLVAVVIRNLRLEEVEALKEKGTPCLSADPAYNAPAITKEEAQEIAFAYLKRGLSNFETIKGQFSYSFSNQLHQWLWEDKKYKLPEGLEGRPYSYPTIRITVNGNKEIQYWNTVPLFEK